MKTYEYYENIEKPCARIFQSMSNRGIRVDLTYLENLRKSLESQREPIKRDIENELGSINLNSPKQLLEALNEKDIYPTLKGKPSTDKRALGYHARIPVVQRLLEYSQIDTLLSSFVYSYLERGQEVVHPFFNQCGTRTGRLSCSNPNLLQIPKHTENGKLVRKMFTARPGMLLGDCDFAAIEPRVLAHLSKDPNLCRMFNDGLDFHQFTADNLGISRDRAKVLNLSVGYRATFKSVSQQLKCGDKEAQDEIDKWWSLFPSLRRWQESLIYESKRSGFCTTLMGRRIRIDDLNHGNSWRREGSERQLINNITQGSAAEIMKLAMIAIDHDKYAFQFHKEFGLLVQVYDELLFESPIVEGGDIEGVKECMENAIKLDVPLTVEAKSGPNWGEVQ
jgi:DNA polymerase I